MTDIHSFFLPQAQTSNTPTAQVSARGQSARAVNVEDATPSPEARDFFDLLFSHFTTETKSSVNNKNTEQNVFGKSGLAKALFNRPEIIVLNTKDTGENDNAELSGLNSKKAELLNKLKELLAGIPELDKQGLQADGTEISLTGVLSIDSLSDQALADIENLMTMQKELTDAGIPALIATNLSPEDLESITENLSPEELENLGENAFAIIRILPVIEDTKGSTPSHTVSTDLSTESSTGTKGPANENPVELSDEIQKISTTQPDNTHFKNEMSRNIAHATQTSTGPFSNETEPSNTLAAQLNNITVGGNKDSAFGDGESSLFTEEGDPGYNPNISQQQNNLSSSTKTENTPKTQQPATLGTVSGIIENFNSVLAGQAWEESWLNGFSPENTTNAINNLSVSGEQTLISPLTYAAHASQAHPATHTVAASLQKMASNGESKALTLQLDPPELGRVEVKMTFGKDKTIKTDLLIEKPETYTMLQRDSHALEKALTDAGLDVSNDSLNFTLAGGENDFTGQGQHQRHSNGSGGLEITAPEGGDIEVINTTLGIEFDPDTGLPHLNMMI